MEGCPPAEMLAAAGTPTETFPASAYMLRSRRKDRLDRRWDPDETPFHYHIKLRGQEDEGAWILPAHGLKWRHPNRSTTSRAELGLRLEEELFLAYEMRFEEAG